MKDKTLLGLGLALALVLAGSGCMTANSATNGLAKLFEAASKDTNSFRLRFNGWGASIDFDRNAAATGPLAEGGGGVTLRPMTTLQVQQTK